MHRKAALLFIALCVAFFHAGAESIFGDSNGGNDIIIAPAEKNLFETDPRSVLTIVFSVRNTGEERRSLTPAVQLPDGWRLSTPLFPLQLEGGASDIVLVSIVIPQQALAGSYTILCGIEGSERRASVTVKVRETFALDLQHESAPGTVLAGQDYESRFSLSNLSNSPQTIKIRANSGRDFVFRDLPARVELEAGERMELVTRISTPQTLEHSMKHYIRLSAELAGAEEIFSEAKSVVEIIPVTPPGDPMHRYPLHFSWNGSYTNDERPYSTSLSLSGRGYLDDRGRHRLDFSLSPPSWPENGNEEETSWHAAYRNDYLSVSGGEQTFSASPLTSGSRSGYGLAGGLYLGPFELSGFRAPADADGGHDNFYGGSMLFNFGEVSSLRMHYFCDEEQADRQLIGISGFLRPYDSASIEFETAFEAEQPDRFAYTLGLTELMENYDYSFHIKHGSPGFGGTLEDTDYFSAGAGIDLMKDLEFRGFYSFEKQNLYYDRSEPLSLSTEDTRLSVLWKPVSTFELGGRWSRTRRRDLFADANYNTEEQSSGLNLEKSWEKVRVKASGEFRRLTDYENGRMNSTQIYNMIGELRPFADFSLRNSLTFDTGISERGIGDSSVTYGLSCSYSHRNRTEFNASYRMSRYLASDYTGYDSFSFGLSHPFGGGQLSLDGDYSQRRGPREEPEISISLAYRTTLRVPVSRKSGVGSISGFVYDRETGKGIPEIIVSAGGRTTVTDESGLFRFPALKVGTIYVQFNTGRVDRPLTSVLETPMEVEVVARESVHLEVPMSQPAAITGQVTKYAVDRKTGSFMMNESQQKMKKVGGLSRVLLEISGDGGARRAYSGPNGIFAFRGLVPGEWNLSIIEETIPPSHRLEKQDYRLKLAPGESGSIDVKILPVIRRIKFMEEGEVIEIE
ncbi:MAG: carboxypeptidase-like regulatory domain-containing protein [Spirochaetales bacterium]|nr:carboxypeptidase-like regulatory domain-containing protein [Spirochaetales bacterium]MCF7938980.1 carboxypeptidase-like regulatory domain-containing protein [Spirochaetales bacterium]